MIEFEHEADLRARIKVVGIGGGGGNAINTMIRAGLSGVDFVAINTDAQALAMNLAATKIHLGDRGLGAGADPRVGRSARLRAPRADIVQPHGLAGNDGQGERAAQNLATAFAEGCIDFYHDRPCHHS